MCIYAVYETELDNFIDVYLSALNFKVFLWFHLGLLLQSSVQKSIMIPHPISD